jgi:hypothetical protein
MTNEHTEAFEAWWRDQWNTSSRRPGVGAAFQAGWEAARRQPPQVEPPVRHAKGCPCADCFNGTTRSNIPQGAQCSCRPGHYQACPVHGLKTAFEAYGTPAKSGEQHEG